MVPRRPAPPWPFRSAALPLCLAAALAPAAAGPAPAAEGARTDRVEQVRWALYHRLMADILLTGVKTATEGARWSIGEVNPYPAIASDKVIAACINWDATTPDAVDWYGYAYYYDTGQSRAEYDIVKLEQLEQRANDYCAQYEATNDCFCQIVDRNGFNALRLPEWFVDSRLGGGR